MLEHPDITRVNQTGSVDNSGFYCEYCSNTFARSAEVIEYDHEYFCEAECLASWLLEIGEAVWTVVGE